MPNVQTTELVDELVDRNGEFALRHDVTGLSPMPTRPLIVVGCVDPRVDPAVVLGLELGEAVVIRNVGGRTTPAVLRTLAMLGIIARSHGAEPGAGLEVVVLHHTDCGIKHLVDHPDVLAAELGISPESLDPRTVTDPRASLAADVAALRTNPVLPRGLVVTGLLYDTGTGRVEVAIPPG
jgi:carbonic anhydrase